MEDIQNNSNKFVPTHYPVMYAEILEMFCKYMPEHPKIIDATAGEGGHSILFLERLANAIVLLNDRDPVMLERALKRVEAFPSRVLSVQSNFSELYQKVPQKFIGNTNGILLDLGVSTYHFHSSKRGFSFQSDEYLDMRLDPSTTKDASYVINHFSKKALEDIFYNYGEESWSKKIVSNILEYRKKKPITMTLQLAEIVQNSIPPKFRNYKIHPATKVFQALRIEVNKELEHITKGLESLYNLLAPNGLLCVISFHSLEDRIVKNFMRDKKKEVELLTKKPMVPTEKEVQTNKASRSAKLRVLIKNST